MTLVFEGHKNKVSHPSPATRALFTRLPSAGCTIRTGRPLHQWNFQGFVNFSEILD